MQYKGKIIQHVTRHVLFHQLWLWSTPFWGGIWSWKEAFCCQKPRPSNVLIAGVEGNLKVWCFWGRLLSFRGPDVCGVLRLRTFFKGKKSEDGKKEFGQQSFQWHFLSYTVLSCQDLAKHFLQVIKTVPLKWFSCHNGVFQRKTSFFKPWAVFSLVIFEVPKILIPKP